MRLGGRTLTGRRRRRPARQGLAGVDLDQRDMLRLATPDAAGVWHLENEVGGLTPGGQADVTIVDPRPPHLDGFGDPATTLVMGRRRDPSSSVARSSRSRSSVLTPSAPGGSRANPAPRLRDRAG
jgi:cytosine/adenosine deaminase-related metal-dependent hydrolase